MTPQSRTASGLPTIRACLFDMDGLLIDSEDYYTLCTNDVLHEYGRPDLPWSIKAQLQGRPGPAASKILMDWAKLPISMDEFMRKTRDRQAQYFPRTQPLPGATVLLETLSRAQGVHIALATSSHRANFHLKTRHLPETFKHFTEEHRVLGDDERIPVGRGKPAPDIYLLALKTLNDAIRREGKEEEIRPDECLVLEDSVPGVEAGRRAGMQVVWCPHPGLLKEYNGREKEVLAGLTGPLDDEETAKTDAAVRESRDGPGKIGDGWAVHVHSLEDFPYSRFDIITQD